MRKFLFRAKPIENNPNSEWIEGYYAELGKGDDIEYYIIQNNSLAGLFEKEEYNKTFSDYQVQPDTVCQYTEVDDKNGTNIFHKDIVSALFTGYGGKKYTRIGVVEYVKGAFCVDWNDSEEYGKNFLGYVNDIEVIGNVFDNPELIEWR